MLFRSLLHTAHHSKNPTRSNQVGKMSSNGHERCAHCSHCTQDLKNALTKARPSMYVSKLLNIVFFSFGPQRIEMGEKEEKKNRCTGGQEY